MWPRSPKCTAGALMPGPGWRWRAALSLVAGVFITVASAWVCAMLPQPGFPRTVVSHFRSEPEGPAWHIQVVHGPWFTRVDTLGDFNPNFHLAHPPMGPLRHEAPVWARDIMASPPTPEDEATGRWTSQVGIGWPFRSMYARATGVSGSLGDVVRGLDLRPAGPLVIPPDRRGRARPWVLPLHPIWPGFAYNTGLFALVVFASWTGIVALGRRRRDKRLARGLCPHCRYPLPDSSTCPECGQTVSQHAESGTGRGR